MQMTGDRLLPVPREWVWAALNDPEVIRTCLPACESLERASDSEFRARLAMTIGPVKAKFDGRLLLSDLDPPSAYRLRFEGSGGTAGFAKGGAEVALAEEGGGTRLTYRANAQVGGKLAQVGSRLVDGVASRMADDFFTRFHETLVASVPAGAVDPAPAAAAAARRGLPAWGWVRVAAIAAAVGYALTRGM